MDISVFSNLVRRKIEIVYLKKWNKVILRKKCDYPLWFVVWYNFNIWKMKKLVNLVGKSINTVDALEKQQMKQITRDYDCNKENKFFTTDSEGRTIWTRYAIQVFKYQGWYNLHKGEIDSYLSANNKGIWKDLAHDDKKAIYESWDWK